MAMVNAQSHNQAVDDGHRVWFFKKGPAIAEDAVESTEVLECGLRQRRI